VPSLTLRHFKLNNLEERHFIDTEHPLTLATIDFWSGGRLERPIERIASRQYAVFIVKRIDFVVVAASLRVVICSREAKLPTPAFAFLGVSLLAFLLGTLA
jgi:hypothetical protein